MTDVQAGAVIDVDAHGAYEVLSVSGDSLVLLCADEGHLRPECQEPWRMGRDQRYWRIVASHPDVDAPLADQEDADG